MDKLSSYIQMALGHRDVKSAIKKFSEMQRKIGEHGTKNQIIRFSFIEAALETVERCWKSDGVDDKKLADMAGQSIIEEINSAIEEDKGPSGLPDNIS